MHRNTDYAPYMHGCLHRHAKGNRASLKGTPDPWKRKKI